MSRKTEKYISWIERDRCYRVQMQGSYIGQRKTYAQARNLLFEAKKDLVGTIDRYAKELPVGITYGRNKHTYRVRVRGSFIKETQILEEAKLYNRLAWEKVDQIRKARA